MPEAARLEQDPGYRAWVRSRPIHIQAAAALFPIGTTGVVKGEQVWLIGWGELDVPAGVTPSLDHAVLLFTTVYPFGEDADYDEFRKETNIRRACASHFEIEL